MRRGDELVPLTTVEFRLLLALVAADGRVLTRDQLLDVVYGPDDGEVLDRTIDVHIGRLRDKLGDDAAAPRYVATVRGVGYRAAAQSGDGGRLGAASARMSNRPGRGLATRIAAGGAAHGRRRGRRPGTRRGDRRRRRVRGPDDGPRRDRRGRAGDVRPVDPWRPRRRCRPGRRALPSAWPSLIARMLARPLEEVGAAARRIADGDYAARVPREGPEEIASLADSFNQMAAALQEQERLRRDFIANAAHELRTPLTNLQGYLEALRDGVIEADAATYDSLWEEADRLVRLARSLDALAEGEAAPNRRARSSSTSAPILEASVGARAPGARGRGIEIERRWSAAACRRAATPTTSPRCSRTCSRTPSATRPTAAA